MSTMLLPLRILLCLALLLVNSAIAKKKIAPVQAAIESVYALDSTSNSVLLQHYADQPIAPASLAKLMTSLIVLDALANKKIQANQLVVVSHDAWINGGAPSGTSTMFAKLNSQISVADLLNGLIIDNANDAAIMLSQLIAGNEENFAKLMNNKARQIGLHYTSFGNATGLPQNNIIQTTNLKDLVQLLQYVISHYPNYSAIAQQSSFIWSNIKQHNKNPLLNQLGKDVQIIGGASGSSVDSGYAMVVAAKKDTRVVYIALAHAKSNAARRQKGIEIANMAFNDYCEKLLYSPGQTINSVPIYGGVEDFVEAVPSDKLVALLDKKNLHSTTIRLIYKSPALAPIQTSQKLGKIEVLRDGIVIQTKNLLAKSSLASATFCRRAKLAAYELCFGWIKQLYISLK